MVSARRARCPGARVREVIDKYGQDGGLIIASTHVLEPEVLLENIDALFDACQEYGRDGRPASCASHRLWQ
jgi:uroporphyrinogen-III decarboxylase